MRYNLLLQNSRFFSFLVFFIILGISLLDAKDSYGQCQVTISGNNNICAGTSTTLTANPSGGVGTYTYSWTCSPNPTSWASTIQNPIVTPSVTTVYTVTVTDSNTPPCIATVNLTVTVNQLPVPDFSASAILPACNGKFQFTTSWPLHVTGMTYSWFFDDGSSNSTLRDPVHQFNAFGNGSHIYNVRLTVTTPEGCVAQTTKPVNVTQRPNASLLYDPPFRQCTSTPGNFDLTVTNNSSTTATNTSYEIFWGDGDYPAFPTIYGAGFTTGNHTYTSSGSFLLRFIVHGNNGCNDTSQYEVFNGSNPALIVGNPGNTTGCTNGPACFTFPISGTVSNLSTTYSFDFGDGTVLNYSQATLPSSITHCYSVSSCSQLGAAYKLIAKAINPCLTTVVEISPIIISAPPVPAFTGPSSGCINTPITFTNTSQNSCFITGSTPSNRANYNWYVDNILIQSNLNVLPPPPNFTHSFLTPGQHTVCVEAWNGCNATDKDSICHYICIDPQPVSSFTITPNSGCSPFEVSTVNNSTTANPCNTLVYTWIVDNYTGSPSCPPNSSSWQFKAGSDLHSVNPLFIFTNPGTYRINLRVTNSCGNVTSSQNVTVKVKPTVSLATPVAICEGGTSCPTISSWSTCWGSAPTFLWNFGGGVSVDPTIQNACATYSTAGTYPITLSLTNECGTTTSTPVNLLVKPKANPTITGPSSACANTAGHIYTTECGPLISGWSWTITGGIITSGAGTCSITVTWGPSGVGTLTASYVLNSCPTPTPTTKTITINPRPVPTINGITTVCNGTTGVIYSTEPGTTGYIWTVSGGNITSGLGTNQIFVTWNTAGTQNVCVNYTDANGCTATSPGCLPVVVHPLPVPTISGPASPCINSSQVYSTDSGMTNYFWTLSGVGAISSGQGTSSIIVNWTSLGPFVLTVTFLLILMAVIR
jgi:large repetitive protein